MDRQIENITIDTTPIIVDENIYYIKNNLSWWDKDQISSASQLVKAEGELKRQIIRIKQDKGLIYKQELTEKEHLENKRLLSEDKPVKYFTDNDVVTFDNPQKHTLAKLTAYIHKWEVRKKDEVFNVSLTPQNIKQIPPHHFKEIIKRITEVESKSQPFQGKPDTKK